MARERNSLRVGIFTIIVVALFFAILLWISQGVGGDMREITVRFKSSPAMPTLVAGSAVLVGGQKVGSVIEAKLDRQEIADEKTGKNSEVCFVMVRANVDAKLYIHKDCQVIAEGPPLGGDGVVKIDLGKAEQAIEPGDVIEGADPGGFGAVLTALQSEFDGNNPTSLLGQIKSQLDPDAEVSLMGKLLQSIEDINVVTASLSKELGDAEKTSLLAKIHAVADNINATTAVLRAEFEQDKPDVLLDKVHSAMDTINDSLTTLATMLKTNEPTIGRTLQHVEATAENIAHETDPTKADSLMAHFKQVSEQLNGALDDINVVTDTTRQVVVLNRENINKLLLNFKEASDHIKTGVKYVLRHPWRLLNEPKPTEMRQQAIFDAARSFSEAAGQIDDASAQLNALAELHEGAIPLGDPDLARIQADLKRTRDKYLKAEAELWRLLNIN
ncbi:MAG: hypothetical protein ABII12_14285 [Planctomycetota bacterium]